MPETPVLVLKTLSGEIIGTIPGAHNIHMHIKYSEPSELTFDIPAIIDGKRNRFYDMLTGHMLIYTKHYGVYITMNPSVEADGISDIKHVMAYSLEKALETKRFFLEEGTMKFYDHTNPKSKETVIGRILETATGWTAGYISPVTAQKYRTFDQYDDYLLSFIYNAAPEKYRCAFVFDTYKKTINVYDADTPYKTLPIYLDFDNLLKKVDVEELSGELVTAIRPYGADGLDILNVNPIGGGWIYNLDYFIAKGDIEEDLADKWKAWQIQIKSNAALYEGLCALRDSATAQLLMEGSKLETLKGELDTLKGKQSVTVQAISSAKTKKEKAEQEAKLKEIYAEIADKEAEIKIKENDIAAIQAKLDKDNAESYVAQINELVDKLSLRSFFTEQECETLSHYFIEQDITEETFVASDINAVISGVNYPMAGEAVSIEGASITKIDLSEKFQKTMYVISGGAFEISGERNIKGDIVRGSMEVSDDGDYVLSIFAGDITADDKTAPSGTITISGVLSDLTTDIKKKIDIETDNDGNEYEIIDYRGSSLLFTADTGALYITTDVSDYQQFAVERELYDHGVSVLSELATPTFEFSVDAGNFLFASDFAPFRDKLELGCGIYLNIGGKQTITPYIIEFEIDFEQRDKFSLVFSSRFKRHDNVNTLKDMIEKSYATSRSFDASRYIYNKVSDQSSQVSKFMKDSLDAAVNTILAGSDQSVVIDKAGITIGDGRKCQIRMVDEMIAMSDDGWETAKLAIGHFAAEGVGEYFGVNAEVIGGKLIVGNNLVIENATDNGVMQFKVDSSGAWLNNSTFVLQQDGGGKILFDPKYGIVGGTHQLYDVDGTTVTPSFLDENGNIIFDTEDYTENGEVKTRGIKMPVNSNFFLDLRDGSAYFRGTVYATDGVFSGELKAATGNFSGTVQADRFLSSKGDDMLVNDKWLPDYLELRGINVADGTFQIDEEGAVSVRGNIEMTGGSISWENINENESAAYKTADEAWTMADDAATDVYNLGRGRYKGTFINGKEIYSPNISWGESGGATGYLTNTTGDDEGLATYLIHLCSSDGMLLEALGGGLRLQASGDIWFNCTAEEIHIGGTRNYINLDALIRQIVSEEMPDPPSTESE